MKKPEIAEDESERLQELQSYFVLDTEAEVAFDQLTKLASHICETPIALVSLIDSDRQWFKSKVGLGASETPRDLAFCAHAIHQEEILIVPDSFEDERFSDNPLVRGAPNVRFYAGAPLINATGHGLGTLCVIDHVPRTLTEAQLEALKILRDQVINQLELRKTLRSLRGKKNDIAQFTYVISHDLRTPLRGISSLANWAKEDLLKGDSSAVLGQLDLILERVSHLAKLIDGMLDFTKVTRSQPLSIPCNVISILTTVINEIKELQLFSIDIPESIPVIKADPVFLQEVFLCILKNAVQHYSGDAGAVKISYVESNKYHEISISDNGPGIPSSYHGKIFEMFEKLDSESKGVGIGLALAAKMMEAQGGIIRLSSELGQGSTFTVCCQKR